MEISNSALGKTDRLRENRKFKRFVRPCDAEFAADGRMLKGVAVDFSLGGLFIMTGRPFSPETVLDIIIHLPDNQPSRIMGKVVRAPLTPMGWLAGASLHAEENGMGIEIIEKDVHYLNFIRSLVD